ncbi:hypothetical protein Taro_020624 [Colocasia esculenta]|uniref:Uncharacterized protein n=1 Tax=Colocasia esculenta TaxID=4460 RepID=A0A843UP57_COLES|nr:hypothetical protein [Colocasia esculenta]
MCEKWNTLDEQNIADRNKANRSHQSMPYRKGRKSHYQLKNDYRLVHDREPNCVEIFKIDRCKELPDGTEQWVDDESRGRYERMIQLSTPSLDSESGSTPILLRRLLFQLWGRTDLVAFITEAVGRHSTLGMGQKKGRAPLPINNR